MEKDKNIIFDYDFIFPDGSVLNIPARLDGKTLQFIPDSNKKVPAWYSNSHFSPCSNCRQTDAINGDCPLWKNISQIVDEFKDVPSFELIDCEVRTDDRIYLKKEIPVQRALSSLMGIIMVTSDCRHLDKLRPMVMFHLPFSSIRETVYRSTSMYMLAQYFRSKKQQPVDMTLGGMNQVYKNIQTVNNNICHGLELATERDSSLNAVIILDLFATMIPFSIDKSLKHFESLFNLYLEN